VKAINQQKHSVTFEDAMHVFDDPYALFEQDDRAGEAGKRRWQALGLAGGVVLLLVAHTARQEGQDEVIRLISARRATRKEKNVMAKLVRKTLADSPMTPARQRKLAQLAQRPDSEIDLSDLPPLKDSFWKNAVRNPFYRPVKQQLTVRLDADVVAWLRQQGKGYQTRLNTVLREAMLEDLKNSA
jgi:uncharacterized DUF497 family protein